MFILILMVLVPIEFLQPLTINTIPVVGSDKWWCSIGLYKCTIRLPLPMQHQAAHGRSLMELDLPVWTASGVVTGLTRGTVTVVYTVDNGTCSNEYAVSLTVNPLPAVAAIGGGALSVCVNSTTPVFTNATPSGVWSIINGTGTASITAGGVVTGLTAGTVTVAYTLIMALAQIPLPRPLP